MIQNKAVGDKKSGVLNESPMKLQKLPKQTESDHLTIADDDGNSMARIVCRYDTEHNIKTCELMANMFENRYPTKESCRRRYKTTEKQPA